MFPVNYYCFGESTFQGYNAINSPPERDYPQYAVPTMVYNTISTTGVQCAYFNNAQDGKTLSENAAMHRPFIETKDLIVLINSGLNDAFRGTVSGFQTALRSIINEARYAGKIAIVQAPNTVNQSWSGNVNAIRSYINTSLGGALGVRTQANNIGNSSFDNTHPDAAGYTLMANSLTASSSLMSPAAVKFIGLAEVVSRLYIAGLCRTPEQPGLDYWVGELLANSLSEIDVSQSIVNANPTFKSLTNAQFVSTIYANIFNDGSASPDGQAYWVSSLASNSRGKVMLDITVASVTYSGGDQTALARQRCFNNKIKMALSYGLCARNKNIMSTSTMSAITGAYSTVTNYTSGLFSALP